MMDNKNAKACPVCGGEPDVPLGMCQYWVECESCGTRGPVSRIDGEAIAAWNKLASVEPVAGDFGEPWSIDLTDPDDVVIWDREGRSGESSGFVANCGESLPGGVFDAGIDRSKRIVSCVNALARLDPEALGEFIEVVEQYQSELEGRGHWRDTRIRDALAKLRREVAP